LKIGFVSLGCPKNLVDSEVMMGQLGRARARAHARIPIDADVLVVNTCSFIDPAKQESIDTILEMAEYKKPAAREADRRRMPGGALSRRDSKTCPKWTPHRHQRTRRSWRLRRDWSPARIRSSRISITT
jgi:hypothetical protein